MAKATITEIPIYYPKDRAEWRAWLGENHAKAPGIWLIYYKKGSGKPTVSYSEAVEEALCVGWIDSRPNTIDAESYKQFFSPRKPKSPWSRVNKQRIEQLVENGLMRSAGLAVIETSKVDGSWSSYDGVEDLSVPADLRAALQENPAAHKNFENFAKSNKKQILWYIESAKRPETRQKRIEQIVASAARNVNPIQYNRNKQDEKKV